MKITNYTRQQAQTFIANCQELELIRQFLEHSNSHIKKYAAHKEHQLLALTHTVEPSQPSPGAVTPTSPKRARKALTPEQRDRKNRLARERRSKGKGAN